MKKNIRTLVAIFLVFAASSVSAQVISQNFTNPSKNSNAGANGFLGTGGAGYNYNGNFGTWLYSNGNGGIDESGAGLGDGSSKANKSPSIGLARAQDFRGENARAISVVFDGNTFINGQQYSVSFDVTGDDAGKNAGYYWLAEVYGYDMSGANYIQIDGTFSAWSNGANKPFIQNGAASVDYLHDFVALENVNVAGTTTTSFTFTYDDANSANIAFAFGAYDNILAVDNFQVAIVPETSAFALLAGVSALGLVLLRHRRQ